MAASGAVMVIEDDTPIRKLLADLLRAEGYEVVEARDGAEAIDLLDAHLSAGTLSLVLLDMSLPRVDGIGVLRHVATRGGLVPVVAISAAQSNLAAARNQGARATLSKPFEVDQLLEVVALNRRT